MCTIQRVNRYELNAVVPVYISLKSQLHDVSDIAGARVEPQLFLHISSSRLKYNISAYTTISYRIGELLCHSPQERLRTQLLG